jgi:hypothetical protein
MWETAVASCFKVDWSWHSNLIRIFTTTLGTVPPLDVWGAAVVAAKVVPTCRRHGLAPLSFVSLPAGSQGYWLPRYTATPSVIIMLYRHSPTRLPAYCFMNFSDITSSTNCWLHTFCLTLQSVSEDRHVAECKACMSMSTQYVHTGKGDFSNFRGLPHKNLTIQIKC